MPLTTKLMTPTAMRMSKRPRKIQTIMDVRYLICGVCCITLEYSGVNMKVPLCETKRYKKYALMSVPIGNPIRPIQANMIPGMRAAGLIFRRPSPAQNCAPPTAPTTSPTMSRITPPIIPSGELEPPASEPTPIVMYRKHAKTENIPPSTKSVPMP